MTTPKPKITTAESKPKTKAQAEKAPAKKVKAINEPEPSQEEYHMQNSIDNCIDIYDTDKCKVLVEEGMDCNKDDMHLLCEKSCGFCGKTFYLKLDTDDICL